MKLDSAIAYLEDKYEDDLEIVGKREVEHLLSGGTYRETEGAQHVDPWTSLANVATVLTILQFSYAVVSGAIVHLQSRVRQSSTPQEPLKPNSQSTIEDVRENVIRTVAEKYNIELDPSDPLLSDESIQSAITFAENDDDVA